MNLVHLSAKQRFKVNQGNIHQAALNPTVVRFKPWLSGRRSWPCQENYRAEEINTPWTAANQFREETIPEPQLVTRKAVAAWRGGPGSDRRPTLAPTAINALLPRFLGDNHSATADANHKPTPNSNQCQAAYANWRLEILRQHRRQTKNHSINRAGMSSNPRDHNDLDHADKKSGLGLWGDITDSRVLSWASVKPNLLLCAGRHS